ncbi:hypothetical protein LIER_17829 [Lithospermum erythrorhizon]|uniref:Uncharacterized protein n=1 Tax=Lithospermum erythrorhizon TaxID=34254 RepID=A0AAV3QFY3_LITER
MHSMPLMAAIENQSVTAETFLKFKSLNFRADVDDPVKFTKVYMSYDQRRSDSAHYIGLWQSMKRGGVRVKEESELPFTNSSCWLELSSAPLEKKKKCSKIPFPTHFARERQLRSDDIYGQRTSLSGSVYIWFEHLV